MPIPSITYTFTDGTTAYGSQVAQDFSDVIAALTDGTKDLTVNSVTTTGAVTIGGAVTLGNAAADVITWNGTAPSILLDNAATDGGAIYFNGGAVDYIKSNAAGDAIEVTGFANFTVTAAGAVTAAAGVSGTTITGSSYVTGTYFLPTADDTSAPGANFLYKANVPKAWASLSIDAASPGVVNNDHNIAGVTWSSITATVTIDTDMADTDYAVVVNNHSAYTAYATSYAVGSFDVIKTNGGLTGDNWDSGNVFDVIVMGDQ